MKKADIGLIGLAVMGENLVVNMESKGFTVAVFNRTTEKVDKFVNGRAAGKNIIGCHSLKELVDNLEKPRKVFMMVKAGQAVDDMIEQLLPLLDDGDILIDGGNSHFPDTIRRTAYVESKGKLALFREQLPDCVDLRCHSVCGCQFLQRRVHYAASDLQEKRLIAAANFHAQLLHQRTHQQRLDAE